MFVSKYAHSQQEVLISIFIAKKKKLTWYVSSNLAAVKAQGAISSCDDVSRMWYDITK